MIIRGKEIFLSGHPLYCSYNYLLYTDTHTTIFVMLCEYLEGSKWLVNLLMYSPEITL